MAFFGYAFDSVAFQAPILALRFKVGTNFGRA